MLTGLVAVLLLARPHADVDLGLHLAVGRTIVQNGALSNPEDIPQLTVLEDMTYAPSQWLAQVIGYLVWSASGQAGILALRALALFTMTASLAWGCRVVAGPAAAVSSAAVAVFGSAIAWGERPQIAGLAAFALTAALLWRSTDHRWMSGVAIPVIWLWAMLHGTWILGIALIACFAAGRVLSRDYRRALVLGAQGVASLAAAAMNPLGVATLTAPFTVSSAARVNVVEWGSPSLTNPFLVAVLSAAIVTVLGWFFRRPSAEAVIVTAFAVVCAVSMVRLIAFGAVALAVPLAGSLASFGRLTVAIPHHVERRLWMGIALVGAATTLTVSVVSPPSLPVGEDLNARLDQLPARTKIAVTQRLSGWVLWSQPDLLVMHDLRAEAYSQKTSNDYDSFFLAEDEWQEYAAQHGIGAILISHEDALVQALPGAPGWEQMYEGREHQLWVRS